jgi:CBS domain containing-hemolysin-like protein
MFGVVTTEGKIVGIVTLEDVLESLIGAEIVGELDTVVDMQTLAHRRVSKQPTE